MKTVGAGEFKTYASALLREAEAGVTICVTRRGKKIAELRPIFQEDREAWLREIEAFRKTLPRFTREELAEARVEGRRY